MAADRSAIEDETVALLQALLRFNTINPPGNELPLAQFLNGIFGREGISTTMLFPTPSRAALIARIKGNGKKRPVMLLAHMDVVDVEPEKWSCDPFGGVIRDGYIYGRGAIDDKGMLAANAIALLQVKRELIDRGIELSRDIVFVATSDEEAGGNDGMRWLVDNHQEHLDSEFALNEGGRTRIIEGGKRYLAIQTAEKISHKVVLTARGPAGHAAIPLEDNAIFKLGKALARLSEYREPVSLNSTTTRFFSELSKIWPVASVAEAMRNVVSPDRATSESGAAVLSQIPVLNAVMRNGISPVGLAGGVAGNVIPAEVSASLNVRTIPGHRIEDVVSRIQQVVESDSVTAEITVHGQEAPGSDPDSAMFNAIAEAAREIDPEMTVVPYLSTGGTDSAYLRRLGIDSYGVLPFPMEQPDEERMHGHDERIPVASLHFGTRLIFESIRRVAEA